MKTWHKVTLGIVGLIVIAGIAGSGDDQPGATTTTTLAAIAATTVAAETTLPTEASTTTTDEATTSPPATTTTNPPATTYTANDYSFADVQVIEDFAGDFEIRTRGTNNGSTQSFVGLTATLFDQGSVVADLSALISDWEAGETLTVEFIGLDDYRDWDMVEFQVDSEF